MARRRLNDDFARRQGGEFPSACEQLNNFARSIHHRSTDCQVIGRRDSHVNCWRLNHRAHAAELRSIRVPEAEHTEMQPARCANMNGRIHWLALSAACRLAIWSRTY